jgi:glucosamine-6-phosphate deaminase
MPQTAVTIGIENIMRAKKILLCVSGAHKSEILKRVLYGDIDSLIPGSILRLHPDLTVVADKSALEGLG